MTLPKITLSISSLIFLCSVLFAFSGGLSSYLWVLSNAKWEKHLDNASITGERVFLDITSEQNFLPTNLLKEVQSKPLDENLSTNYLSNLTSIDSRHIKKILFKKGYNAKEHENITLFISSQSNYLLGDNLHKEPNEAPIITFKAFFEDLARFCDSYRLFVLYKNKLFEVNGNRVWSCDAQPSDYRIFALFLFFIPFGFLAILNKEISYKFNYLTDILKNYSQSGKQSLIKEVGPKELKSLISTLNRYLILERDRLKRRIMVLSMISHDLGTPATRLKFRVNLIENKEIKKKIESDINQMTKMIDSVLNYARSELNTEVESKISLTDLLSAIVSDYEDRGEPVTMLELEPQSVEVKTSLFSGNKRKLSNPQSKNKRVIVNARPLSLQRAIENLIDNSLKYGRRAKLSLRADSRFAYIFIEDEGVSMSEEALNELVTPFKRGENASLVDGVGLGLTVVTTIAEQHGGTLSFERTKKGIKATMKISRH